MSDYFFYDLNKKMADLANKQQLAETAQATPAKPAPNKLMEAAADYSAKKAAAGKDIGKPGKNFSKIAADAGKRYGSAEAGKRVAGAVLNKLRHTEESIDQAQLRPYKATMKEASKPDFLDLDKDGNRKEPMKSAARGAKKDMDESALQAAFGKKKYGDQGMKALQKAGRDHASDSTMKKIRNQYDKYDESMGMADEGNAFSGAVVKAKQNGIQPGEKITVGGKQYELKEVDATPSKQPDPNVPGSMIVVGKDTGPRPKKTTTYVPDNVDGATAPPAKGKDGQYPVVTSGPNKGKRWSPNTPGPTNPAMKEGGMPMTAKQQKFTKITPPVDKITFADKIVGAKKASSGRNRDMDESFLDDEPTRRRSSSGGEIDTSEPGRTIHRAVKGNYSGAGHDVGADDEPTGAMGRRKVGAGMGKKIGAKINRGTSKLMTREGDMPEDMIKPQDSGEYDREGEMAKDSIKTVVRHAQALEKILGDDDNLPEWVQSKLAKIENMMTAVDDYMQNQKSGDMPMDEESTNKRDSRAERAGRKVAKDIEYDEKKKDGIHGQRRGSEDSRAERAGKKVTKDIEYDEKKNKKKKDVDETTSSGSVATGTAPKSSGGVNYGGSIYDSLNRQLENMISEGMNINMSMNNDDHGGPRQSLTVTATDDDAVMLAGLLKMAGMGSGDEEACSSCGSSPCGCDDQMMDEDRWGAEQSPKLPNDMTVTAPGGVDVSKDGSNWVYKSKEPGGRVTVTIPAKAANKMLPNTEMDEAYGDTDASENDPDYPTDEVGTDDAMMYSGGLNGPKSTGQTTSPIVGGQDDRMGYEGDNDLRRMMEIAGLR
jgi:hypothetical protein